MPYTNIGKQVIYYNAATGATQHVADAAGNEEAHSLTTAMNERSPYYIRDALVTKSPDFHGDKVSNAELKGRINGAIDALTKLDMVKKSLFYGRDNNLIAEGVRDASMVLEDTHGDDAVAADIIHAILGIATEAGELLEALRDAYNGDAIDWVNVKEELGDVFWYMALLANRGDFTFEEVMKLNNTKLRTGRFAGKFTAAEANERKLDNERALLEGGYVTVSDDGVERNESVASLYSKEDRQTGKQPAPGMYSGQLALEATEPASGGEAVERVAIKSNAAFDAYGDVKPNGVDAPATQGNGGQLNLSPAERDAALPGEHLAHQPIRPEDTEK